MAKTKDKKAAPKSKRSGKGVEELIPAVFKGMDPDSSAGGGGDFAPKAKHKAGESKEYQFPRQPGDPDAFIEIEEHQWKEGKRWFYVPCLNALGMGKCPLCKDKDEAVSATRYKVFANVYDFSQKKMVLFAGGSTFKNAMVNAWKKNKKEFCARVWDINKFDAQPWITMDRSERDKGIKADKLAKMKLVDVKKHIMAEVESFFGKKVASQGKAAASLDGDKKKSKKGKDDKKSSALDDAVYTEKGLSKKEPKELKKIAKAFGLPFDEAKPAKSIKAILKAQG